MKLRNAIYGVLLVALVVELLWMLWFLAIDISDYKMYERALRESHEPGIRGRLQAARCLSRS